MNKGQKKTRANFDVLGRIRFEQDKRSWSDYELAENSDITPSTISTWTHRNIEPGIASIEKICKGLGITLAQFFQEDESVIYPSDTQKEILDLWAELSPEQRRVVIELIKVFR